MNASRVRAGMVRRLRSGRTLLAVGRAVSVPVVWRSPLFDRGWYELQAGRRFSGRTAAVAHYVRHGSRAGLSPCRLFEAEWYQPGRWRSAPLDPLAHLVLRGRPDAQTHPLLDPLALRGPGRRGGRRRAGAALEGFLTAAGPSTVLPVPPPSRVPSPATAPFLGLDLGVAARRRAVTLGELWDVQDAGVRQHHRQEALRTAPRTRPATGRRAADDLVAESWAAAPLPRRGDGPLVSVVMPARDRQSVVGRAVRSVLAQTLPDWELLVVDDGSVDGTAREVVRAAAGDARVRVLPGPARGVSAARNVALEAAGGAFVAFLDSDNAWTPDFLRTTLASLHARAAAAAYATALVVRDGGDVVRDLDAQEPHLTVRNHVDLNVLVVERALLDDVGRFDESLRRTVDYDLVWRLARRTHLLHVPLVGVVYDDDRSGDRLSTRERRSWKEVVRRRHLVDWPAAVAGPRTPSRTSVVVVARRGWEGAWRAARAVLDDASPATEREVVVVDAGNRPSVSRLLQALALVDPGVRLVRAPDDVGVPLGLDLGLAEVTGDVTVLLAEDALPAPGVLDALRGALDDDGAAASGAVLLDGEDVVAAAGTGGRVGRRPEPLLEGLPREDVRRLGHPVAVPAVRGEALAARTADLLAEHGADPLLAGGLWDVDLCLRLARRRSAPLLLVTDAEVRIGRWPGSARGTPLARPLDAELDADVEELSRRWHAEMAGWQDATRLLRERVDPRYRRERLRVRAEAAPSLRWALRTATVPGAAGDHWGDRHFGEALARGLESLGQEVVVDNRYSLRRETSALDDVALAVRGKVALAPGRPDGPVHLMWVISHPDLVAPHELEAYDRVYAAGAAWAASSARGRPVELLLQATDPTLFHPDAAEGDVERHDVLFVGNSRAVYRPVVRALVEAGQEVAVYGGGWERFLPPGVLRGTGIDNSRLSAAYRGAGLVLNDHWEDMRRDGFASNRLFDAAASGARVVSDRVEGLDPAVLGPLIRTYRDPAELVRLVREGPSAFPDDAERTRLGLEVGRRHSFTARAEALLAGALAVRASRPGRR